MSERVAFPMNAVPGGNLLYVFTQIHLCRSGIEGWPARLPARPRPPAFKDANTARGGGINIMKFLHFFIHIHICDPDRRNVERAVPDFDEDE